MVRPRYTRYRNLIGPPRHDFSTKPFISTNRLPMSHTTVRCTTHGKAGRVLVLLDLLWLLLSLSRFSTAVHHAMSRPPEFHYEPAADDFSPSHQALQYPWSVGIMGEHRMTRFGGTYWTGRGHGRRCLVSSPALSLNCQVSLGIGKLN